MTMNFCTFFDSFYLSRGLAMHSSLEKECKNYHLYIIAFDDTTDKVLRILNLPNVTVISLSDFEDEKLLSVKSFRTKAEYCWTCTPSVIYYCLKQYDLDACTYLDADLFFFNDPSILIHEMGNNSVLITEHRYSKKYDQSETSGIYCVQFITFKNTDNGLLALQWWKERCIEWCYDRFEEGKFGDQKYLDDWPSRFKGVHVLQHLGGGLAPWNIQQYKILKKNNSFSVIRNSSSQEINLIFFHFHAVRFLKNKKVDLGSYKLSNSDKQLYSLYLQKIESINVDLQKFNVIPFMQTYQTKKNIPVILHKFVRRILGVFNVYNFEKIIKYGKTS